MKKVLVLVLAVSVVISVVGLVRGNGANSGAGISISISPNVLALNSRGGSFSVHSNIPYADCSDLEWELEGESISPTSTHADDCGHLVAKFNINNIKEKLSGLSSATLKLSGLIDGEPFGAEDTITVKSK